MTNFSPPWADKKQYDEIVAWIHERLSQLGYTLTSPIEVVSQWELSCVLRVPTDQGNVFFKAAVFLPGNAREAILLPALSKLSPEDVPIPLAVEPDLHWLLLSDVGPDLRSTRITGESIWKKILRQFATLQIRAVGQFDDVLPNQGLAVLATQIESLLTDSRALSALKDVERRQIRQSIGDQISACERLAQGAIPLTMVHGDLHGGNIAFKDGVFRYFDWTEASVSHPFFDLFVFLNDVEKQGASLTTQRRLRDAYLSQWIHYEGIETLRNMYQLAVPLAAFHQAIIYNRIADALAPTPDAKRRRVGEWLRKCLSSN